MRGQEPQPRNSDYAQCEDLLRRGDRDRWLACLFVPQALRPHIHALYAFSLEIARVREIVSEPLLGEIRFQWWRDALDETGDAGARANPIAAALLDTIARFSLPRAPLLELIDARLRDLYDDPIESPAILESYTEATCASLFRLSTQILDGEEVAAGLGVAGHAGIAYGITGLLRALPWHCARVERSMMILPPGVPRLVSLPRSRICARLPARILILLMRVCTAFQTKAVRPFCRSAFASPICG